MRPEPNPPPNPAKAPEDGSSDRREFLRQCLLASPLLLAIVQVAEKEAEGADGESYRAEEHFYGMGIDVKKCIGCGRCADACKTENDVPREPFYFRFENAMFEVALFWQI